MGAFAMSWTKRLEQMLLAGSVLLAACSGAHTLGSGVDAATDVAGDARVPLQHRSTPARCTSQRGPGPAGQPYPSGVATTCMSDSQCTAGADGRCFPFQGLVGIGGCSYDECFTDSDCGSGATCLCRSSPANSANVCVHGGNCLVDSDCGPGNYCSPSLVENCLAPRQYFCHTASDTCLDDSDCPSVDAGASSCPITNTCAFDTQAHRWTCIEDTCCLP